MTKSQTLREVTSICCLLGLLTNSMFAQTAPAQTAPSPKSKNSAQNSVQHGKEYGSYFESNQSGLKGRTSYLAFTNRRAFDKVFGAAAVMGGNKFLLDNAFETGMVAAVIKRGNVIWNYQVKNVIARDHSVTVHYSAKFNGTNDDAESEDASRANFASPLIVAVDRKDYTTVFFVENGKTVGKVTVGAPKIAATPKIKTATVVKPINKPGSVVVVRPIVNQKKTSASKSGAVTGATSGTGERFFEGTYRVGAISCQVNPIKMAFEVKWAGSKKPQLFFTESLEGKKAGQKPTYRAEESGGSARFIFDNARFETGRFVRGDGKMLPIRKTSKPRLAKRQVFVYLVVVGDAGKSGRKFGCDDSLVAVRRSVPTLESPLMSALQELISLPPAYPGNSKLQNFWKGRNLQIQTVSVRGGVARIQMSGEVFVAGICDEPRILTQIEATARQFPSVRRVKVFIGGQSLKSAIQ